MDFTDSQYAQLTIALLGGILLFISVYQLEERTILGFLILMIPFQLIDSRFGSLNTVITYLVTFAFLLQGRITKLPFLGPILIVLFGYLLSFSQGHPAARMQHLIYLVGFGSNALLFFMVYNFILRTGDWRYIFRLFVFLNILVIIYCAIQFFAGSTRVTLFGIDELSMHTIRPNGRLLGPFKATAATVEYISLQAILLGYVLLRRPARNIQWLIISILALNGIFLVATGNRGGFITIILAGFTFFYVYRRQLGLVRIAKMFVVSGVLFTLVGMVVVNYTAYDMLFDRLEGTTVEDGVPDTRANVWPESWERIQETPILGHGPKLFISTDPDNLFAGIRYQLYPHNLALHILFTTGIVGLVTWIIFFWALIARLLAAKNTRCDDEELAWMPRAGLAMLFVFFVSQIRIEFLREGLIDYQNYFFTMFAMMLACADLIFRQASEVVQQRGFGKKAASAGSPSTVPYS